MALNLMTLSYVNYCEATDSGTHLTAPVTVYIYRVDENLDFFQIGNVLIYVIQ